MRPLFVVLRRPILVLNIYLQEPDNIPGQKTPETYLICLVSGLVYVHTSFYKQTSKNLYYPKLNLTKTECFLFLTLVFLYTNLSFFL